MTTVVASSTTPSSLDTLRSQVVALRVEANEALLAKRNSEVQRAQRQKLVIALHKQLAQLQAEKESRHKRQQEKVNEKTQAEAAELEAAKAKHSVLKAEDEEMQRLTSIGEDLISLKVAERDELTDKLRDIANERRVLEDEADEIIAVANKENARVRTEEMEREQRTLRRQAIADKTKELEHQHNETLNAIHKSQNHFEELAKYVTSLDVEILAAKSKIKTLSHKADCQLNVLNVQRQSIAILQHEANVMYNEKRGHYGTSSSKLSPSSTASPLAASRSGNKAV